MLCTTFCTCFYMMKSCWQPGELSPPQTSRRWVEISSLCDHSLPEFGTCRGGVRRAREIWGERGVKGASRFCRSEGVLSGRVPGTPSCMLAGGKARGAGSGKHFPKHSYSWSVSL